LVATVVFVCVSNLVASLELPGLGAKFVNKAVEESVEGLVVIALVVISLTD
jgi:uncharacterized membrane protein